MQRARIFSLIILFGLLLFSSSMLAQDKGKITVTTKVKVKKSKLDLVRGKSNYRIVSIKEYRNEVNRPQIAKKKKKLTVIEALKEEFRK